MSALRRTVLLPVVALLGCFPPTEKRLVPPCLLASVKLNGSAPPVFEWPLSCGVAVVEVSAGNNRADIKWRIAAPNQLSDILSPVTYGQVPAGIDETTPAAPLVSGTEYRMNLLVWVEGVANSIASVPFTQP